MRCAECRLDPDEWTRRDVVRTVRHLDTFFGFVAEGAPPATLAALAPYADALAEVPRRSADLPDDAAARAAMHRATEVLAAAGRVRHAGVPALTGRVAQVSVSRGGVPKLAVASAAVSYRGLVGDRQAERRHHGSPWQALCLWSSEVIAALAAEGHPIAPGCTGENVTVSGLDWAGIRPGQQLRVGTALVETTPYSLPCVKNARWFRDGDFRRMQHERFPGWSRIYARVLEPGEVRTGDPVVLEPH